MSEKAPHSSQKPADEEDAPRRAWDDLSTDEGPGFFQRHRSATIVLALAATGALVFFWNDIFPKKKGAAPRRENVVVVSVPPPPPPPPPPIAQPPPPPVEEKMIEQAPVDNEPKPAATPDEPPPASIGTNIAGGGPPDAFGLSGAGRSGIGGAGTGRQQQRSRWGWYASQVQSRVQEAVRTNKATRAANLRADVKIWADSTGRVTRAAIASSTGNSALDAALRDQVLTGMRLSEAPPEGMPMPITLRVTARRP